MAASLRFLYRINISSFSPVKRLKILGFSLNINTLSRQKTHRTLFTSTVLRKEENKLQGNPFYDKYAEKIKYVRDSDGTEEGSGGWEDKMQIDSKVVEEVERFKAKVKTHQTKKALSINTHSQSGDTSQYGKMSLDSILHLERIEELSGENIAQIWKEYHQNKDCISACIPNDVYSRVQKNSIKYPMFVYPLPRENGYEFMFAEFSGNLCYITPLLQYQTVGENAPWVLAIKHFTELKETKELVLMVGEVDTNQLSVVDAQWLGYQIQMYYASNNPEREKLLRIFNKEPEKFDHMSVVEQLNHEIDSGALYNEFSKNKSS